MQKGISREHAVATALELLNDVGLDGLTVRRLADRLEVKAPALYWHFSNKQDLLDEMGTQIWRRIVSESDFAGDWRSGMKTFACVLRSTLLSYRDGAKLFSGTFLTDPAILAAQEEPLSRLVDAGFSVESAVDASYTLYSFVVGATIEEQSVRQAPDNRYALTERERRLDPAANPLMTEAGRLTFGTPDQRFDRILDRLLDAFEGWKSA